MSKKGFKDVNEYIAMQPVEVRERLEQFRQIIRKAAPEAEEAISYQMPAYRFHGMLVYFAGWKEHIGFYPAGAIAKKFGERLKGYRQSKGTIQFPLDERIPVKLVQDIVKYRMKENKEREILKKAGKSRKKLQG
jgi:uncharacterized protein YdhG (YjbR/CyaY superfamily)